MAATCSGRRCPRTSANNVVPTAASDVGTIAHRDRRIEARAEAARRDLADRLGRRRIGKQQRRLRAPARGLRPAGRRGGARRRCRTARGSCPRRENRRRARRRCGGFSAPTIPARPRPAWSWCRCRGRRGRARPRAAGCRARQARSAARRDSPAASSPALRRRRPAPKSQSRPRRYSRSARRSSRSRPTGAGRHP